VIVPWCRGDLETSSARRSATALGLLEACTHCAVVAVASRSSTAPELGMVGGRSSLAAKFRMREEIRSPAFANRPYWSGP
jgi:hypothetical protein